MFDWRLSSVEGRVSWIWIKTYSVSSKCSTPGVVPRRDWWRVHFWLGLLACLARVIYFGVRNHPDSLRGEDLFFLALLAEMDLIGYFAFVLCGLFLLGWTILALRKEWP